MSDIEERVKEMLERRSQDIGPVANDRHSPIPGPPTESPLGHIPVPADRRLTERPRVSPALVLVGIAAAMLVLTGGFLVATRGDDAASTASGEGQRIATESDVEAEDAASSDGQDGEGDGVEGDGVEGDGVEGDGVEGDGVEGDGVAGGGDDDAAIADLPTPTIEDFLGEFPDSVNLLAGATVYAEYGGTTAEALVASYLAQRLPDLPYSAEQVDADGPMTLFRWSVSEADIDEAGSVLVRGGDGAYAVVAATTDGMTLVNAVRSLDTIEVTIADSRTEDLAVDINTLYGSPVPGSPNPDGLGPADVPIFASAGSTDGDRIDIALTTDSQSAVVLAQNIGGTMLTVLEFPLDSPGFGVPCGSGPPLTIDVGSLLGPLEDGPAPQTVAAPLVNQQMWHYPGPESSIEIRWPADPVLIGRADPTTFGDSKALSFRHSGIDPDGDHVLAILEQPPTESAGIDPCSVLQFSVLGDPVAVDWWTTALSGELSFDLPLSIADLDPAIGPDGGGESEDGAASDELVIGTEAATTAPRLPATGSCDGLPNDPPRTGGGSPSDAPQAEAEAALEAFVNGPGQTPDPPLATRGYTGLRIDDQHVTYVYPIDNPVIIVNVELGPSGWVVTTWEASPC